MNATTIQPTVQARPLTQRRATIEYLRHCQRARAAGYPVSYTTDPAWLVQMAINRRAGWLDDPSHQRGSCMPVAGKYPKKGGGDWFRHLQLVAREVNSRCVVRQARLGEHRWLMKRLPHRFEE